MTCQSERQNHRKLWGQLLIGGAFGAIISLVYHLYFEPLVEQGGGAGASALATIGMLYCVMGLFVGLGLVFPAMGTKLLNVEDRDDLADQRAILTGSAVCCIALGIAFLMLALSGPQGQISGVLAAGALAFALILSLVISVVQWKLYDEMTRGISMEVSAFMAAIQVPAISLWALLTHLGWAGPIDPLGLIALLAGAMLPASLLAAGRRGLLLPS